MDCWVDRKEGDEEGGGGGGGGGGGVRVGFVREMEQKSKDIKRERSKEGVS